MCKPKKDFKLCTCGEMKRKPKNFWILYREEKPFEQQEHVMGSIEFPDPESDYSKAFNQQIEYATELLNSTDIFDFDYQPSDGDQLVLHLHKFEFWMKYSKSNWSYEGSIPFDHPEYVYKKLLTGKIK